MNETKMDKFYDYFPTLIALLLMVVGGVCLMVAVVLAVIGPWRGIVLYSIFALAFIAVGIAIDSNEHFWRSLD